jgi:hypothetical protein
MQRGRRVLLDHELELVVFRLWRHIAGGLGGF